MITLKQFITEDDYENDFNEFLRSLKLDCQPFLKINEQAIKRKDFIWRGFARAESANFFSKYPRTDRKPLTTNKKVHQIFDSFFEKEFDFKYRTSGVFATRSRPEASGYSYAGIYAIFPVMDYTLLSSHEVQDLYAVHVSSETNDVMAKIYDSKEYEVTPEDVEQFYKELKGFNYFETQKIDDIGPAHEIMIKCKKYYAIRLYEDGMFKQLGSGHEGDDLIDFVDLLYSEN